MSHNSLYIPNQFVGGDIETYLADEFNRISEALATIGEGKNHVWHVEPEKPREGQTVYADGSDWDPGFGEGLYSYDGTNWIFGLAYAEDWITPTLVNGWMPYSAAYNTEGYYKDSFGVVHLRGLIKNGTTTPGTTLFTLPVGYRPVTRELLGTITNPNAIGRIDVNYTGVVTIELGDIAWLSLDGLTFRAV